ncbi:MAG: biopolymer transporter ExbD [Alphaproteobacteria bacterium]
MRLKRKTRSQDEANLIPLINIVFLILIFFLAAGVLRSFHEENVSPAEANYSDKGERPIKPVLIGQDGQISVGGVEHDQASLKGVLQGRSTAGITSPLPVVADKNLAAEKLVEVIEAAKMAGIKKIRLVTQKRSAP